MMTTLTGNGQDEAYIYTADDERIAAVRGASTSVKEWRYTVRDLGGKVLREADDTQNGSIHLWKWKEDWIYRDGTLLAAETAGPEHTEHFHLDHLGTPRMITNFSGTQLSLHTYYPFGQEVTPWTDGEVMKYTGHERDLSLDYMRARYFETAVGRFLSSDRIAGGLLLPQSANRYTYVQNLPVEAIDPTGLRLECVAVPGGESCRYTPDPQPSPAPQPPPPFHLPPHDTYDGMPLNQHELRLHFLRQAAARGDEGAMMELGYPASAYGIEPTYDEYWIVTGLASILRGGVAALTKVFTPDQQALVALAKEAARAGTGREEAKILVEWAKEYGMKGLDHSGPLDATHWVGGPHVHIGPVNHIPVR